MFRKTKETIKLHALLDARGSLLNFIYITNNKVHDVNAMDKLVLDEDAFYIMDKVDFAWLYRTSCSYSFFVVEA